MKIIKLCIVDIGDYNDELAGSFCYVRVNPEEYKDALLSIITSLMDNSWLKVFDNAAIRKSFEERAKGTIDALSDMFKINSDSNPLLEDVGEYIVSFYALQSLNMLKNYNNVPLMELLGVKNIGNHGFDFYSENVDDALVVCGEAKYLASGYGYNSSLKQINDFISDNKHIKDVPLIERFISKKALDKLVNNKIGVCSAFSSKKTDDNILKQITNNCHFIEAFKKYESVIITVIEI